MKSCPLTPSPLGHFERSKKDFGPLFRLREITNLHAHEASRTLVRNRTFELENELVHSLTQLDVWESGDLRSHQFNPSLRRVLGLDW